LAKKKGITGISLQSLNLIEGTPRQVQWQNIRGLQIVRKKAISSKELENHTVEAASLLKGQREIITTGQSHTQSIF